MKDWKVIYLPLSEEPVVNGQVIEGAGWKLTLNAGWKMEKIDSLHYTLVKGANQ